MTSEAFDATVAMLAATNLAGEATVAERRGAIDGLGALLGRAADTSIEDLDAGGVPARWVRPDGASPGHTPAVLWLHGGGYNIGSVESHTPAASHLAAALGAPVLIAGYRLAPEDPFPAALDDALAVWRWLVDDRAPRGALGVVGDSAGGGLALAMAMALRANGEPRPAAMALLCPWLDLTDPREASAEQAAADVVLSVDLLESWAQTYAGATPLDDPALSPIFGDLGDLPPMLVHTAGRDLLCEQSRRFAAAGTAVGLTIDLEVDDDMIHAWHLFAGAFPEAGEALGSVARWLAPRLAAP